MLKVSLVHEVFVLAAMAHLCWRVSLPPATPCQHKYASVLAGAPSVLAGGRPLGQMCHRRQHRCAGPHGASVLAARRPQAHMMHALVAPGRGQAKGGHGQAAARPGAAKATVARRGRQFKFYFVIFHNP